MSYKVHNKKNKQGKWKYAKEYAEKKDRSKNTEDFLWRRFIIVPFYKSGD